MNCTRILTVILLGALPLMAGADNQENRTLAATGSAHYRFERLNVDSPDGQRHYRLDIGIPRNAAPATGYPVMYLLDGNNALAELQDSWLGELDAGAAPLLVMIGYDIDGTYDGEQRTRDYTGDTASAFLTTIETRIKPKVRANWSVDPKRQTLWGHSFGGLFVLGVAAQLPGGGAARLDAPHEAHGVMATGSYAWVVPAGKGQVVIVDAGQDPDARALSTEVGGREVLAILLTHAHAAKERTGQPTCVVASFGQHFFRQLKNCQDCVVFSLGKSSVEPDRRLAGLVTQQQRHHDETAGCHSGPGPDAQHWADQGREYGGNRANEA